MLSYHHGCTVVNKCNRNGLAKQDREKPMRPQKTIHDLGKLEMGEVAFLKRSTAIGCPVPSGHAQMHTYKSNYTDWKAYIYEYMYIHICIQ